MLVRVPLPAWMLVPFTSMDAGPAEISRRFSEQVSPFPSVFEERTKISVQDPLNVMAILGVAGLSLAWRSEGANLDAGGEEKTAKVPAAEIAKKKDDASALPIKPFLTLPCPDGAHCLAFS